MFAHPANAALVEVVLRQGGASDALVQQRACDHAEQLLCMAARKRQPAVVERILTLAGSSKACMQQATVRIHHA
jgi:hypothetical protein